MDIRGHGHRIVFFWHRQHSLKSSMTKCPFSPVPACADRPEAAPHNRDVIAAAGGCPPLNAASSHAGPARPERLAAVPRTRNGDSCFLARETLGGDQADMSHESAWPVRLASRACIDASGVCFRNSVHVSRRPRWAFAGVWVIGLRGVAATGCPRRPASVPGALFGPDACSRKRTSSSQDAGPWVKPSYFVCKTADHTRRRSNQERCINGGSEIVHDKRASFSPSTRPPFEPELPVFHSRRSLPSHLDILSNTLSNRPPPALAPPTCSCTTFLRCWPPSRPPPTPCPARIPPSTLGAATA
ncbi:hypothetical protein LX36DRAFT_193740 [Colletotrichum falcatum]|nr:hypothetical protein LX36DRAFT_193740 [Colletotrichum falcatum]